MTHQETRIITDADRQRLARMMKDVGTVGNPFAAHVRELVGSLAQATVVPSASIGPDVVTMNSRVTARDLESGRAETFTLVYHGEANMFGARLSVLAPLGVAALGSRVGDVIEWRPPRGVRRLRVERIDYQPEAAGHLDL